MRTSSSRSTGSAGPVAGLVAAGPWPASTGAVRILS
jgi:hypothetical protein